MHTLIAIHGSAYDQASAALGAQLVRNASLAPTLLVVASQAGIQAEGLLAPARQVLAAERPDVETRIETGSVVARTLTLAREGQYDLVVIGEGLESHAWPRRWQEPVGVRMVKDAPCPILVVKGQARLIQRILLCDSGAGIAAISRFAGDAPPAPITAGRVRQFTARLVELLPGDEQVTVLHVMSQVSAHPGRYDDQLRADAEALIQEHTPEGELLQADMELLKLPGVHSYPVVRHGLVVDEILAQAREGDYDLVMIGAHRAPGWQRFLLDDLASQIVRQIDRPVLVV